MTKLMPFLALTAVFVIDRDPSAEALRACGSRLVKLLYDTCKFHKEKWPCFRDEFYENGYGSGEKRRSTRVGIATECCDNECEIEAVAKRCCFSIECLQACYPGTNYTLVEGLVYPTTAPIPTAIEYDEEYEEGTSTEASKAYASTTTQTRPVFAHPQNLTGPNLSPTTSLTRMITKPCSPPAY
ncbi:hypothetical protein L596_000346 [Steinernema carpocapsae]|uniref:Insulin-like domain-containing protein n=1 Tax=Steinernema carpocapsae TaxID=34508 RepID=A0A4U8UM29_STECR|nr:hypothetical protein L596_000346 [Steinernema carpocapsae]